MANPESFSLHSMGSSSATSDSASLLHGLATDFVSQSSHEEPPYENQNAQNEPELSDEYELYVPSEPAPPLPGFSPECIAAREEWKRSERKRLMRKVLYSLLAVLLVMICATATNLYFMLIQSHSKSNDQDIPRSSGNTELVVTTSTSTGNAVLTTETAIVSEQPKSSSTGDSVETPDIIEFSYISIIGGTNFVDKVRNFLTAVEIVSLNGTTCPIPLSMLRST